ncbi:TIGR03085 family metal-binding protein [Corynebacterium lubricantis]|uniref:TIGR03085 family metal-binding protein n=1 Tax=Corynebacterium lubricantis TaxID=541095 RepID=UPI000368AE49|nr:TIGR03085 family metal-binding protein [Corynebacterium lubricantis]
MSFAQAERARLAETLLDVGPDAPTLCEGWTTRDLAEHLYNRENQPTSHLDKVGQRARNRVKNWSYEQVVAAWVAGPPKLLQPIDSLMNTAENFVHHEDVRRGDGVVRVRDFSKAVDKQLAKAAAQFGKMLLGKSPVPVILSPTTLPPITVADRRGVTVQGDNVVRVIGEPGELLLWVFGRDVVDVKLQGSPEHIAQSRGKA